MINTGQKIAANLSWLSMQELIGRLVGFFTVVYLARLLPQADYGALNICLTLMAILTLLVRAGTGSRATRLTARDAVAIPSIHAEITGLRIVSAILLITAITLFCVPLGKLLSVPAELLLLSSALLVRPALAVAWAFRGLDDMRPIAFAGTAERLVVLAGLLLFIRGGDLDVYLVVLLEVSGAIIVVLWLRLALYRRLGTGLPLKFGFRRWGSMIRESWPLSLAALVGSLYRYGDVLLLGILTDSSTAAIYLVGQKIVLTLALLPTLVGKASFPSTSRALHQDETSAISLQTHLIRLTLAVALPITAMIILLADPLVRLLFGDEYLPAADTLRILSLTLPFFTYATFQENLLLALPKPRTLLACRIVSSVLHMLLAALLIPSVGALGAAIGCLAGSIVFALATATAWYFTDRGPPLDRSILAPLLATGATAAVFFALADMDLWLKIVIAALVYLTCLFLLKGIRPDEIATLVSYSRGVIAGKGKST